MLVIRENDLTGKPVKEGDFDRAWFRLSNEETNQTLDFSKFKHLVPEDYQPMIPPENDDAQPTRNDLTFVHGRLYLTDKQVWVFESYKHCFQRKDWPDIVDRLTKLQGETQAELDYQETSIQNATNAVQRSLEDKKLKEQEKAA